MRLHDPGERTVLNALTDPKLRIGRTNQHTSFPIDYRQHTAGRQLRLGDDPIHPLQIERCERHRAHSARGVERRLRQGQNRSVRDAADVIVTDGEIAAFQCAPKPGVVRGTGALHKWQRAAKHLAFRRQRAQVGILRILFLRVRHKPAAGHGVACLQGR